MLYRLSNYLFAVVGMIIALTIAALVKIDCLAKLVYLILGKIYEMDKNISNIHLKSECLT
jgi:hypothetical protein